MKAKIKIGPGLPAALIAVFVLAMSGLPAQAEPEKSAAEEVPLQELRIFAEIFGRIKKDYVEPVGDKELLEYAIRGMLEGLDPHSAYLDETHYKDLQEGTSGEFGGLGLEVGMEDGFVKVIAPIDDTPAQAAGIQAGDLIIRLDDKSVKGMSLSESVDLMRGKPGTKVKLTITRSGESKPLVFHVTRDIIKLASVKQRYLEPGFGYIRLSQFQAHTSEDMLKAISKLKKEAGGALRGLILDLRNNPGGVLNAAVSISDAFLSGGMIVYTEGRVKDSLLKFNAAPDDVLMGAPIVVLVNEGSASASEIVAGALQDHNRAIIMGQPTFGKGSVQTIIPVNSKIAIKLTTARYYTPKGRSIQAEGIVPDIVLEPLEFRKKVNHARHLKEADLQDHLVKPEGDGNNGANGKTKQQESGEKEDDDKQDRAAEEIRDYALNEALNLLKGLAILNAGRGGAE